MDITEHDLRVIRRACRTVAPPPGMGRDDLEQEVALRLLRQELDVPKTDGLLWFLARQRARSIVRLEPDAPDALGHEPPAEDRSDDVDWPDTLARLSWRDRVVLDLRYRLGMLPREVGVALGTTERMAAFYLAGAARRFLSLNPRRTHAMAKKCKKKRPY